jgi:hypothetical protein
MLLERWKDDRSAGAPKRLGKRAIRFWIRWGTEVDIEGNACRAGERKFVDQFRMQLSRPRPDPDRFDGRRIIATTTTSPLACLGKVLKRRPRREFFNAVGTPVSNIATREHTTKRCGRILFTPPHRMALAAQVLPRVDV